MPTVSRSVLPGVDGGGRGVVKPITVVRAAGFAAVAAALAVAVAAGSLAGQPVVTGNDAGPTPICGALATATWDNTGSPFNVCASGATIPFGATITVDGSKGAVQVHSLGGGITVSGGVLLTTNTSSINPVTCDGPTTTPGSWPG